MAVRMKAGQLLVGILSLTLVAVLGTIGAQIYLGRKTTAGTYSEVVQLAVGGGFCTGVVVSDRAVLTARHCVGTSTTARIGSPDWSAPVTGNVSAMHGSLDLALFCTPRLTVAPA